LLVRTVAESGAAPIAFWYGGLLGMALAGAVVLAAVAMYAFERRMRPLLGVAATAALIVAAGACWALVQASSLNQANQLAKSHPRLMRLVVSGVLAREALEDVRSAAESSSGLTTLLADFDRHETSIDRLLEAEWRYQRRAAWDEPGLLHAMTWSLTDVLLHHARWSRRDEALQCPEGTDAPPLADLQSALATRVRNHHDNTGVVGDQFEGFNFPEPGRDAVSDVALLQAMAWGLAGLALLAAAASAFVVYRNRSFDLTDAPVVLSAIVLAGVGAWLALGAGAEPERLRESLYSAALTVHRETIELQERTKALALSPRAGIAAPRITRATLLTDHADYVNMLSTLHQLVRVWDEAVLTGRLDPGIGWADRIRTRDELVDEIRSRTLAAYRRYVQLDAGITSLTCRSEWFPRDPSEALEDRLVALPPAD
jgi:hypothetical protein